MAAVLLVVIAIILFSYFVGSGVNNINTDVYVVNKMAINTNVAFSRLEQGFNQHQIAFNSYPQQLSDIVPVFIDEPVFPPFMHIESFHPNFGAGGLYTGVCIDMSATSGLELRLISELNKSNKIELSNFCDTINTDGINLDEPVDLKLIYLIRN